MAAYVPPSPIIKPYCNSGAQTPPPITTSTTIANQEIGFPPLQATPLNAGGIPVDIEQFNGILKFYSNQIVAIVSGYKFTFDQDFSDLYVGYNEGVILYCEFNNSYQRSLINNNTFNFDTNHSYIDDGVHWISDQYIYALTANTGAFSDILQINGSSYVHNGGYIAFFNTDNSHFISLRANQPAGGAGQDTSYIWPLEYPSSSGLPMTCSDVGQMSWGDLSAAFVSANGGIAPSPGFIGYIPTPVVTTRASQGSGTDTIGSITLDPGRYLLFSSIQLTMTVSSGVLPISFQIGINTTPASFSGVVYGVNGLSFSIDVARPVTLVDGKSNPIYPITITSPTTFYFVYHSDFGATDITTTLIAVLLA